MLVRNLPFCLAIATTFYVRRFVVVSNIHIRRFFTKHSSGSLKQGVRGMCPPEDIGALICTIHTYNSVSTGVLSVTLY